MALRSLLRKTPALASALRSLAGHASSPLPGLKSPSFQALAPAAAGARAMSRIPGASTVYTREKLREEGDRVHAELLQSISNLGEQIDEFYRVEAEHWARLRQKLDTVNCACDVIIALSVTALALQAIRLM